MIFLIFFITSRKCFPSKIKGKHFPGNQTKFSLTGKCFLLTGKYFLLTTFLIINKDKKI